MEIRPHAIIEAIEEREQSFIQHIRTSGLRKPRETALIDELLDLRKERRRLFSIMQTRIDQLLVDTSGFETALEKCKTEAQALSLSRISALESALASRTGELAREKDNHNTALQQMNARFEGIMKSEKKSLSAKYEQKLQLIEARLNDLSSGASDRQEKVQNQMERDKAEMEAMYLEKIAKFKDALVSVVDREKSLTAKLQRKSNQLEACVDQLEKLSGQVRSAEDALSEERKKRLAAEESIVSLENRLRECRSEVQQLSMQLITEKQRAETDARLMQQEHNLQLSQVDDKVRLLLSGRDQTIRSLRSQVEQFLQEQRQAEQLLQEIK